MNEIIESISRLDKWIHNVEDVGQKTKNRITSSEMMIKRQGDVIKVVPDIEEKLALLDNIKSTKDELYHLKDDMSTNYVSK